MNTCALLHKPMSEYAHGLSEDEIIIRLRAGRDDLINVTLFFGDTACRKTPIDFYPVKMNKVASDLYFDYYEACIKSEINRIYYYFLLNDGNETKYYFSDFIRTILPDDRSEYYKLPYNHRADLALTPKWVKDAVIYNIFPDSFATSKEFISGTGLKKVHKCENENIVLSKNGGTINGITENVNYLKNLGVNCIYLNPFFAACEYHKYDTVDYFSVDPCFGSNDDFKRMISVLHENGIRVLIDGVFNHCGWNHFAFMDVVKNQENSKYVDWFYDLKFPVSKPKNPEDYPTYACFAYERLMPKLNTANPEVRDYLCKVGEYWIKEFDVDGWRLDVASEVNDDFWRCFRKRVKEVKSDAFIIGEVWEKAGHWMQGDMYDSCMNYDLRKFCKYFFAESIIDSETFDAGVTDMLLRYKKDLSFGQLNLLDSHDVSRFLTVCDGNVDKFKLALIFQMMFKGVPSIFYGDEQGFVGVTEDEYRRPMSFETKGDLFSFYKKLIDIRKNENSVKLGEYRCIHKEFEGKLYSFEREFNDERVLVVLNPSDDVRRLNCIDKNILRKSEILMSEGIDALEDGELILRGYGYIILKY